MRPVLQFGLEPLLRQASLLSAALAVGLVGNATGVAPVAAKPEGAVVRQAVHVIRCGTTWTPSGPHPTKAMPNRLQLSLPPALARRVGVYADSAGFKLLGPLGWACTASYHNGAFGIWLNATGPSGDAGNQHPQLNQTFQACVECSLEEACPLFATAAADLRSLYNRKCPTVKPAGERVVWLSSTTVAFEDPPHLDGDGDPSGGPFPTNGVLTYLSGPRHRYSTMRADCVMIQTDHPICTAVLNAFLGWYGNSITALGSPRVAQAQLDLHHAEVVRSPSTPT